MINEGPAETSKEDFTSEDVSTDQNNHKFSVTVDRDKDGNKDQDIEVRNVTSVTVNDQSFESVSDEIDKVTELSKELLQES